MKHTLIFRASEQVEGHELVAETWWRDEESLMPYLCREMDKQHMATEDINKLSDALFKAFSRLSKLVTDAVEDATPARRAYVAKAREEREREQWCALKFPKVKDRDSALEERRHAERSADRDDGMEP